VVARKKRRCGAHRKPKTGRVVGEVRVGKRGANATSPRGGVNLNLPGEQKKIGYNHEGVAL